MKRKLFICSLIAICLCIAAIGTTAYFSHEDDAKNIITAGDVKIDLLEWSVAEPDGERVPYESTVTVMPSTELSKIVEIKNIGSQSAWVRVSVEKAIQLAENVEGETDTSLISLDFNTEDWREQDGYFYYLRELKSGETTEPLFTTVSFSKDMKNRYQNSTATINVKAQAVQWVHNGGTVFDAVSWSSNSVEEE